MTIMSTAAGCLVSARTARLEGMACPGPLLPLRVSPAPDHCKASVLTAQSPIQQNQNSTRFFEASLSQSQETSS